jgi:acyl carrier protein
MQTSFILFSLSVALTMLQAGCSGGRPDSAPASNAAVVTQQGQSNSDKPRQQQETLARVTKIVAEILNLKPEEVYVNVPLTKQKNPADELDVVEIVMSVEEAFNIEIKDEELGGTLEDATKDLTVTKLVDIVAKKKGANK